MRGALTRWRIIDGVDAASRRFASPNNDESVLAARAEYFSLRPCHCPRDLYYLYIHAGPGSGKLAIGRRLKRPSLTGNWQRVCKRFSPSDNAPSARRRGRNFYRGAASRPEILITRLSPLFLRVRRCCCRLYRGKFDREICRTTYVTR